MSRICNLFGSTCRHHRAE